ncbi:hypothetical protein SEMRO_608_G174850.1 [Seminavis robusta]|uniref:Uncharacterized protein n=1 Tax=Seminavis robusta TaxID=568900 RepID=A0A9N8E6X4_9STRA|nr:hypothetical protein SEMRO_608_G174850.1 [Seminavis robusta]|eukprot:Sro608_g174850.1 n/a (379) ;mRNA; r:30191-31327
MTVANLVKMGFGPQLEEIYDQHGKNYADEAHLDNGDPTPNVNQSEDINSGEDINAQAHVRNIQGLVRPKPKTTARRAIEENDEDEEVDLEDTSEEGETSSYSADTEDSDDEASELEAKEMPEKAKRGTKSSSKNLGKTGKSKGKKANGKKANSNHSGDSDSSSSRQKSKPRRASASSKKKRASSKKKGHRNMSSSSEEESVKRSARKAGSRPLSIRQMDDAKTRRKLCELERPMSMLQRMSLPVSRTDDFDPNKKSHKQMKQKAKNWPSVIHGCFTLSDKLPNEDGHNGDDLQGPRKLTFWTGSKHSSRRMKRWLMNDDEKYDIEYVADFNSFLNSRRSESAQQKNPPPRREVAQDSESSEERQATSEERRRKKSNRP